MTNQRDTDGWRVPNIGTKSRLIYGLLKYGLTTLEIAAETGFDTTLTRVLAYKIRRPDWANRLEHGARVRRRNLQHLTGSGSSATKSYTLMRPASKGCGAF